jgi:drug/metabolite transporter (DMT)-like permease
MSFPIGILALLGITVIWGTTFAIVKNALDTIPAPLLLALRFSLAALFLAWVRPDWRALRPALVLGVLAFLGFATQTLGLTLTSASNAAFITGFSVILVPALAALWLRRNPALRVYLAGGLALLGLGLMTLTSATGVNAGDLWVLGTALSYAMYILYLAEVARGYDALTLASLQHWPMALLAWLWALPHLGALPDVPIGTYLAILYLAAAATALVAVLQTYAQRVVPPYLTALIFVLEPVFAAIFAFFMLGEALGPLGWLGAGLVVAAMLLSELKPAPKASPASSASR